MSEYVSEDAIRTEDNASVLLEVKSQVEKEWDGSFRDYVEISDLEKGQRIQWLRERAQELEFSRHQQLLQRREELIQQELSRGDPIQAAPEPPQPSKQEQLIPIRYLFGVGLGALLIGFGLGRRLSEYEIVYKGDQ